MTATVRFGQFELCPATRQLLADGKPVALGARAFDVLHALIERRERLVVKSELLDLVWSGRIVEENNLAVQISTLRKVLGPQAIATIPGRGYRFALPLDGVPQVSAAPAVPPSRAADASTTNLPDGLPHLYGRDREVGEVVQLLAQYRLVTIVGAGGIGKTRLGQAVAHRLRGRFDDGVWLIELAALSDPARVAGTLAHALNMPVSDEADAFDAAIDAVRGKELLLVLDNCEHLLDTVSVLATAMRRAAPGTSILTTSQEPLKIADEHVYRLGTLAVPLPDAAPDVDAAPAYGAVALFVARAQAADPCFALNAHNVNAVLEICRRLDGIALALELAAARIPLLGVEGLRSRLDERFNLLRGGARTALRRHQTLRATLEWSHALLSDAERAVFRRLGVFVGGFAIEATQQVACDATMDAWEVLDELGALVDKSLVAANTGDPPRYRLLETTRLFALEKLASSGETSTVAQRHAFATLAILQSVDRRAWTLTGEMLLAELGPELDNLRAALTWAGSEGGDPQVGVALVGASKWLWECLNLGAESMARILPFERWACEPTPLELQTAYWLARTFHFVSLGGFSADLPRAAARSIELSRRLNDSSLLYDALVRSAVIASRNGRVDIAQRELVEARTLEKNSWPPRQRALRYFAEAEYFEAADQLNDARAAQEKRIALLVQAGERGAQIYAYGQLVAIDLAMGEVDQAISRGRDALANIARGYPPFRARFLMLSLAQALATKGLVDEAGLLVKRALPLLRDSGGPWVTLDLLAQIWMERKSSSRAAQLLACADRMFELHGWVRKPYASRRRASLVVLLAEAFTADELARLQQAGASMSIEEAIALGMSS